MTPRKPKTAAPPAQTASPAPPVPLPDHRLARVVPGPDVLLTLSASVQVEEWLIGWLAIEQLAAAMVPPPGPLFLHGKPGTGKTALTRMIARRLAGVREVVVIDAMRVTEGFLGATSANIAKAASAAIAAGAVLVLEEIDTLASARAYGTSAEVENARATTSIMRVLELGGPIVLTSNRLDVIDPAVIRRCEYLVEMPAPTASQRRGIVERELGADPGPVELSLTAAIPLAKRARRTALLDGRDARDVFEGLVRIHGGAA